jgi:hypothetical protein
VVEERIVYVLSKCCGRHIAYGAVSHACSARLVGEITMVNDAIVPHAAR